MQISIRSHMTAGMAAVVGISAIALTPALPSPSLRALELPTPAVAEIALTGTSLPLTQIWTLLQTVGTGGSPNEMVNVVFSAVGTEFATQATPLVTAAVNDVVSYLAVALNTVLIDGGAQPDIPGILSGVGTAVGAGDLPGALQTLTGGLTAPITHVVQTVFGPDFQAFLTNKLGTVLGALPEILRSTVQKVLGLDIKPVTDAIAATLTGLVPKVSPGASIPAVSLASAVEAPTIVAEVPAVRPGSAATVPVGIADEAGSVPAVESPAPKRSAVESADQTEPDAVFAPPRVAHRGAAESAGDPGPAVAKPVARHRGASDASSAAAGR